MSNTPLLHAHLSILCARAIGEVVESFTAAGMSNVAEVAREVSASLADNEKRVYNLRQLIEKLVIVLALAGMAGMAQADDLMGPPAPVDPYKVTRVYTEADHARARGMWKLYAAGIAVDAGTTLAGYLRHDNVTEGNLVFRVVGDRWWRYALFVTAKAGLAVHLYRRGREKPEQALTRALVYLSVSAAVGTWNLTVTF